jgi:predicted PurR-regulated permease PerM
MSAMIAYLVAILKTLVSKPMFWAVVFGIVIIVVLWYIHRQFNKLTLDLKLNKREKVILWVRIAFALIAVHFLYLKFFKSTEEIIARFKAEHQKAANKTPSTQNNNPII